MNVRSVTLLQRNWSIHRSYSCGSVNWEAVSKALLQTDLPGEYHLVHTPDQAAKAAEILWSQSNQVHACDTETYSFPLKHVSPMGYARLLCATICCGLDGPSFFIDESQICHFREYFESNSVKKIWHNYGFDYHVLRNLGMNPGGFHADTMHMAAVLDATFSKTEGGCGYSLEALSGPKSPLHRRTRDGEFLYSRAYALQSLQKVSLSKTFEGTVDPKELRGDNLSPEELYWSSSTSATFVEYALADAIVTWRLHYILEEALSREKWGRGFCPLWVAEGEETYWEHDTLLDAYYKYWVPLCSAALRMQESGLLVDKRKLEEALMSIESASNAKRDAFFSWACRDDVCGKDAVSVPLSTRSNKLKHMIFGKGVKDFKEKGKVLTLRGFGVSTKASLTLDNLRTLTQLKTYSGAKHRDFREGIRSLVAHFDLERLHTAVELLLPSRVDESPNDSVSDSPASSNPPKTFTSESSPIDPTCADTILLHPDVSLIPAGKITVRKPQFGKHSHGLRTAATTRAGGSSGDGDGFLPANSGVLRACVAPPGQTYIFARLRDLHMSTLANLSGCPKLTSAFSCRVSRLSSPLPTYTKRLDSHTETHTQSVPTLHNPQQQSEKRGTGAKQDTKGRNESGIGVDRDVVSYDDDDIFCFVAYECFPDVTKAVKNGEVGLRLPTIESSDGLCSTRGLYVDADSRPSIRTRFPTQYQMAASVSMLVCEQEKILALTRRLGASRVNIEKVRRKWHDTFPGVQHWLDRVRKDASSPYTNTNSFTNVPNVNTTLAGRPIKPSYTVLPPSGPHFVSPRYSQSIPGQLLHQTASDLFMVALLSLDDNRLHDLGFRVNLVNPLVAHSVVLVGPKETALHARNVVLELLQGCTAQEEIPWPSGVIATVDIADDWEKWMAT
eukprot:Rmarinus@m.9363